MSIKSITGKLKKGTIIVEVEGFFVERFLNLCKSQNVDIHDIKYITVGLITFKTSSNNFSDVKKLATKTRCKARIKKRKGIYFVLFRYKKRRMFVYLFVSLLLLFIILSTFVLKINITGNQNISNEDVLKVLKKADVYVGKNRLFVDERKAVNMLRTELYDIAWVGVEKKGTTINVKIVEKTLMEKDENQNVTGNIISNKSGVITKIIAENGTAKLRTGSYIEKGMTAIEGVIESELIGNVNVRASGILKVKSSHTFKTTEKYNIKEKVYTKKKKYGIGIGINDNEYILKYLPKNYIYDINKKEKVFKIFGTSFKFIYIKYEEYNFEEKTRSYQELEKICKEKYKSYMNNIKKEGSSVSNENVSIKDTQDGIDYTVAYDLEEDAGVFEKTGE